MSETPPASSPASSGDLPELAARAQASWREKKGTLFFWFAAVALLFRPLLWSDYQSIVAPAMRPDGLPLVPPGEAWLNLGADLLCFLIVLITLFKLISGRIGFIALNTFREAVRNRILYFILFFALILMLASGAVKSLTFDIHGRTVINIGLVAISFFGLMAAVFVGISLVYNELDRKTIYTIVSKPVHRYQFLLGKFFGLLFTIYVILGIMTVFFFAVFNYQAETSDAKLDAFYDSMVARDAAGGIIYDESGAARMHPDLGAQTARFYMAAVGRSAAQAGGNLLGFETGAVSRNMLIAVVMICLELMIVTAIAVLFSSFSTPTLSAMFTVMLFLAGRLNEDIMRFAERVKIDALKEGLATSVAALPLLVKIKIWLAQFCALIVPNLDSLNVTSEVVHSDHVSVWRYSVLYALCYTGMILTLAIVIFRRRNFK